MIRHAGAPARGDPTGPEILDAGLFLSKATSAKTNAIRWEELGIRWGRAPPPSHPLASICHTQDGRVKPERSFSGRKGR
ncbi:RIN3 isoform 13 [Pongo abelii]|uniref:RIN3 isoform 13 n=1 Tax=Pongo abelii TaxID=9601 RepID=A0A2J8W4S0_PONAB|nr:RIN3 isoform 13 [Pongo abelii]